jgi:hypothetical protein
LGKEILMIRPSPGAHWRYQPVYVDLDGERRYSLCEVYLDGDGRLEHWTVKTSMAPEGDSPEDLVGGLRHMMRDAQKWVPVQFTDLVVGMAFREKSDGR